MTVHFRPAPRRWAVQPWVCCHTSLHDLTLASFAYYGRTPNGRRDESRVGLAHWRRCNLRYCLCHAYRYSALGFIQSWPTYFRDWTIEGPHRALVFPMRSIIPSFEIHVEVNAKPTELV